MLASGLHARPGITAGPERNGVTLTVSEPSSTGTVTITAEDKRLLTPPAKELTVSAAVTSGPTGLAAPASSPTLTITDDETAPTVTLKAGSDVDLGGRRREHRDGNRRRTTTVDAPRQGVDGICGG